ncbi:MAG: GAF domain-containing protein [Sandaracinaceae bacterium]|nr:GAF domain-containing protein [Sandaracinaceae bacterium]MCC6874929.1 GAF domain-containing protein [Sandaracinaceae bacterium]
MADDDERPARTSDVPVDLGRERESFVRTFLRKGVELTEGLLEENKSLQAQLAESQREIARLRAQVASDDAIRDLIRKIDSLERERNELLAKSTQLEQFTRQTEDRNYEVEQELHDLANLYIASSHLHSTLSVRGVVRHVKELLQQLVGSEKYGVFLLDEEGKTAIPIAFDGVAEGVLGPILPGEGPIGEVLMTGVPRVADRVEGGSFEAPLAVIPLLLRDRPVGVIAIATVFRQKAVWAPVDHELFKLLGNQAAAALAAANLYAAQDGPMAALRGVHELLSQPSS